MVVGGGDRKAKKGRSSARHRLHEDDTISVEMNQLQRAGQVELIVNRASQAELTVSTGGSRRTPVPIAECSERTLALAVVLTPNSLDLGEDRLARADMLRLGQRRSSTKGQARLETSTSASSSRSGWLQTCWRKPRWDEFTCELTRKTLHVRDAFGH